MTGADGRQRVNVDVLKQMEYLLPTEELVRKSGEHLKPLFDNISLLNIQCHKLKVARDKLLPKLLSGEIEV